MTWLGFGESGACPFAKGRPGQLSQAHHDEAPSAAAFMSCQAILGGGRVKRARGTRGGFTYHSCPHHKAAGAISHGLMSGE